MALGWKASGVAQPTRVSRLAKRLKYDAHSVVISAHFERMCLPLHELQVAYLANAVVLPVGGFLGSANYRFPHLFDFRVQ